MVEYRPASEADGLFVTCPQRCILNGLRWRFFTPGDEHHLELLEQRYRRRRCPRCGDQLNIERIPFDDRDRIPHDAPDDVPGPRAWPSLRARLAYWRRIFLIRPVE